MVNVVFLSRWLNQLDNDPERDNSNTGISYTSSCQKSIYHKGLDGARMQEIADLAGINKALLHYYFRRKTL